MLNQNFQIINFFSDEKQIDLAEQVESVSYVLCGQDVITLEKFCQIFLAKGVFLFSKSNVLLKVSKILNNANFSDR